MSINWLEKFNKLNKYENSLSEIESIYSNNRTLNAKQKEKVRKLLIKIESINSELGYKNDFILKSESENENLIRDKVNKLRDKCYLMGSNAPLPSYENSPSTKNIPMQSSWKRGNYKVFRERITKGVVQAHEQEASINSLSDKLAKRINERQKLLAAKEKIEQEMNTYPEKAETLKKPWIALQEKIIMNFEKIDKLQKKLRPFFHEKKSREVARREMRRIGGEEIEIPSTKGALLNGMFLDAEKFRKMIIDEGGRLVTIRKGAELIKGIALPKNNRLFDKFTAMNAFPDFKSGFQGAGLTPLSTQNGLFLISDVYMEAHIENPNENGQLVKFDHTTKNFYLNEKEDPEITYEPLSEKIPGGAATVILTGGNNSTYEEFKKQAFHFLLDGANVLLFNFRGVGESKGAPSFSGYIEDYESAYQWVKNRLKAPDSKILFKALCMSTAIAAIISGRHPEVNVFLDQPYSKLKVLAEDRLSFQLSDALRRKNHSKLAKLAPVIGKIGKCFLPKWDGAKGLSQNKGQKFILLAEDENFINNDKHISDYLSRSKSESLTIFTIPGTHGTNWVNTFADPYAATYGKEIKKIKDEIEECYKEITICDMVGRNHRTKQYSPEAAAHVQKKEQEIDAHEKKIARLTGRKKFTGRQKVVSFLDKAGLLNELIT